MLLNIQQIAGVFGGLMFQRIFSHKFEFLNGKFLEILREFF